MADIGDVCNALVNMASAALYPSGVSAGSPLGLNFRVYRGHPGPDVLDADMQAGFTEGATGWALTSAASRIGHVCVNSRTGVGRMVRPYVFACPQISAVVPVTVTASVSGTTLTIGGTVSAGQGVAAAASGVAQGITAGSTDTATTLATGLAAVLTANGKAATASGTTVSVPGAVGLVANTFVQVATGQEVERQIQGFELTLYCPGRDVRDAMSATIKPALAAQQRFTLPDGFQALMRSAPPVEIDDDRPEKALLFVRRLFFQVEYATVLAGATSTQAIAQQIFSDSLGNVLATPVEA